MSAAPDSHAAAGSSRRPIAIAVSAGVLGAAALAFALSRSNSAELRDHLRRWQVWSLGVQVVLVATFTAVEAPVMLRLVAAGRRWLSYVAVTSVLAALAAGLVAPQTSRIYYDEQIYQSIGQNIAELGLAEMCNAGTVQHGRLRCALAEYNKEPYGYPYLLSLAYRLAGVHEWIAFRLNNVTAGVTVWAVFFSTALLFGVPAGSFAALVMAFIPVAVSWSNTAAAEPTASLFVALTVMAAALFLRTRSTRSLLWTMVLAIFAAQFRQESFLVVVPIVAMVAVGAPREFLRPRLYWGAVASLFLGSVIVAHMYAVRSEGWGTAGPRLSAAYVLDNLRTNGWFYVWDPRFPPAYTVAALVGLLAARSKLVIVPCAYFLTFWGVFLIFYAGSYNYGADVRYSLMTYPPIAMLAGLGLWTLISAPAFRSGRRSFAVVGPAIATIAVLLQFAWYVPRVRLVGEDGWAARADVTFARRVARWIPSDAIVLTQNPGMFHVWGVNAAQMSLASTNADYLPPALLSRYPGGVYVHWNFWCDVLDPVQQAFCVNALSPSSHRLVAEYRERDFRYAFYRLESGSTH